MRHFNLKKIAGLLLVFALVIPGLFAQEKNDAIKAFNEAVELMKTDQVASIALFESCMSICEQVGDSAYDIQVRVEQVLPGLYYQKAYNVLIKDQNITDGIAESKKAMVIAEKYYNDNVKGNAEKLLVSAYSGMAKDFINKKEYDNAILAYDSVLLINPDHVSSLYNKAMLNRSLGRDEEFESTLDNYLSKLDTTANAEDIEKARKIARDYYRVAGGKANQAKKYTDAVALLDKASKYGLDENVCYQYASVYNKLNQRQKAVENAQKGLELTNGSAEDKAKYYFELAEAQFNLGNTSEACAAYKNAKYGPFVQAAEAQLQNLNCQ